MPVPKIAQIHGSPFYLYSQTGIENSLSIYQNAFGKTKNRIFYAVKACSNLSILKLLHDMGSYFDVVSTGELYRVAQVTGSIKKCIFSGVGKSMEALEYSISNNIHCINVESMAELDRIIQITNRLKLSVNISFRINPNIDAKSHPYISTGLDENKFGISLTNALTAYKYSMTQDFLNIIGLSCHIGSQIKDLSVFSECTLKVLEFHKQLIKNNIELEFIDFGGGLGICYESDEQALIKEYVEIILSHLPDNFSSYIYIEPGRSIVGKNGILVTRVEYIKENVQNYFAVVDAAMNDLIRPTLYNSKHRIVPVNNLVLKANKTYQIVGPVCETSDTFSKSFERQVQQNDLLAILDVGAYGATMSSHYNTRPNIPEVLVKNNTFRLIRKHQSIDSILQEELDCLKTTVTTDIIKQA
ncbi:MAG: diaminopimelate decarboxylase [Francisellaceae bacterium]|nr:diaminopimelate decarboxylase [Francisellaceae bacterium]